MSLTVFAAIDIVEDQVVRLRQGDLHERTVYGQDPVEMAEMWQAEGADWLHVIDLDGATRGEQANSPAIERILTTCTIPVQVGGGIRSIDAIARWLDKGAARVCIGTKAIDELFLEEALSLYGERIVAAIDAKGGTVRVAGWLQPSGMRTVEAVRKVAAAGVSRILFTDIERDGTMRGPNLDAIEEVLDTLEVPCIASGGVDAEHSVAKLARLSEKGLEGVVIGKALYSGALTLSSVRAAIASA